MTIEIPKEEIVGYECRHVTYVRPPEPGMDDLHVVKEIIHTKDGKTHPNLRFWKNFKRPYGITQIGHRNHKQKKEWEDVNKLNIFESRQCDLIRNAARSLGVPWFRGGLRNLAGHVEVDKQGKETPVGVYLYGADILSTAVLKRKYQDQFPNLNTPFTVAAFDIETDVVQGTGAPVAIAVAMGNKVYTAVRRSFVDRQLNVHERLQNLLQTYLPDIVKKRGLEWYIDIVDDEIMAIRNAFKKIHEWKPDFLSIWNMNFDIKRIKEVLEYHNIDPAEIFSDPSVPDEYKYFFYREGPEQKVTASQKMSPIKPASRWHTVYTPASYYVIDAMCAYRHIRNQFQEEQSYSLDAILNKELDRGKLTFPNITTVTEGTLEWHQEMQANYPLEYLVYNLFDVVGMLELDDKIQDLSLTLPMFSGCSDFENFDSQPRRMVDDIHYYCLAHRSEEHPNGLMIATTSREMQTDLDKMTVDPKGWIIALAAHLVHDNGMQVIEHAPWLRTNYRSHTGDLDVSAAYPTNEEVMNISMETTHRELCEIEGISEDVKRKEGINLSGGHTNAIEIATELYGLPTLDVLLAAFEEHLATGA
jgi:DNA polymerase elongation subunit (family B)